MIERYFIAGAPFTYFHAVHRRSSFHEYKFSLPPVFGCLCNGTNRFNILFFFFFSAPASRLLCHINWWYTALYTVQIFQCGLTYEAIQRPSSNQKYRWNWMQCYSVFPCFISLPWQITWYVHSDRNFIYLFSFRSSFQFVHLCASKMQWLFFFFFLCVVRRPPGYFSCGLHCYGVVSTSDRFF